MDRSNPYFVARKPERTKNSQTVRLHSSLSLLRAPSTEDESSAETRYTYPEPPTQEGNGGYWAVHSYLAVSLAPREHADASLYPSTQPSAQVSDRGDAHSSFEHISYSSARRKRPTQHDPHCSPRASTPIYTPVAPTNEPHSMAMLGTQQSTQPFGTTFPRPAGLYPPMLPLPPHSISSNPSSITHGHRAGTLPTADVQAVVTAVYALGRADGRPPLRKHLLDPTDVNPALYSTIRKHFSSSTGVMRYDSPVRMWHGDSALFSEEWWKYLTESVKRGT
nr:hypothetical protein B0A51_12688 [Rachicladosporium sp. CCFEE 5018]